MNPAELLTELEERGVKVSVVGEKLRLEAPAGTLSSELKEAVSKRKAELIRLLSARQSAQDLGLPWDSVRGLTKPCHIAVTKPEWQAVLGRTFWLAPNQAWAERVRRKYPEALVFTVAELVELVPTLREKGPEAPGLLTLIQAKRMFAGTIVGEPA
jgi:hypothetical protein